jgi:DNA-binding response OmpR family regulator
MKDVSVVGSSALRAELLVSSLERARPSAFSFTISEASLAAIDVEQVRSSTLLSFVDSERAHAIKIVYQLRTDYFCWEPIHLLIPDPPRTDALTADWAIYFHATPPDVHALAYTLAQSEPLPSKRRLEIVQAALVTLADALGSLSRSLNQQLIKPDRLLKAFTDASNVLSDLGLEETYGPLVAAMKRTAEFPVLDPQNLEPLLPLVVDAERKARDSANQAQLATTLHKLNNVLRLGLMEPGDGKKLRSDILVRLVSLRDHGLAALPEGYQRKYTEICNDVERLLNNINDDQVSDEDRNLLNRYSSTLNSLLRPHAPALLDGTTSVPVQRIVVTEDDPDWRRSIVNVLQNLTGVQIKIEEAGTVMEAEALLKDPQPALALIDLGLPLNTDSEPMLDAGLGLIKRFNESDNHGKRFLHRFIVLTAAENFAEAVREALGYGISPTMYLQKNPRTWENELTAQVRLALQPQNQRVPSIEVFKRTSRIARIEGLEIKLDYPHWCLLAILATSRRGRWSEPQRLSKLLFYNYSVNPDARNIENEALDPEARILNQLPHYTSELNLRLADAYAQARHEPLPVNVISFDPESGYRLNANARVLDQVEEHLLTWPRPKVLAVEDSAEWGKQIVEELTRHGFEVRLARCIGDAREMMLMEEPDLISLDLELPMTRDELEAGIANATSAVVFLEYLRDNQSNCPVAILTAIPWQDQIMLEILRKGVRMDDYLSKHSENPISRLANSLARLAQESLANTQILDWDPLLPLHPIKIDPATKTLTAVADFPVAPAGEGMTILKTLSATPNVFVSRAELLDVLYGEDEDGPENPERALNSHITRLRKSITDATGGKIPGDQIVCGDRGIYWLRGVVQSN